MMRFFRYACLLALACYSFGASAQRTGNIDTTINFLGASRAVSMYVPPTYNPAVKYRLMVGLHGLGDTCFNYRNVLINTLGWGSSFGNTIFVFPESSSLTDDYYTLPGGEGIIPQCVSFAMSMYHIDTQNVVLQGFSLGGRAALRYGLDHPADFKGLLLNTPAVQGIKEALNGHAPSYSFNYANAAEVPIFMTVGSQDITYTNILDTIYEQLVRHDAVALLTPVPGMGHSVAPVSLQQAGFNFFDNPSYAGADAEAVMVYDAPWVCNSAQAMPSLLLRNTGRDTLHQVSFNYTLFGATQRGLWTGTLTPYQHAIVPVPVNNAKPGDNLLSVQIDSLNGNIADPVAGNNTLQHSFALPATAASGLNEGFEGTEFPPAGWMLQQAGEFYTPWAQDNTIAKDGANSATAFNTIFIFDNQGRAEGLVTPPVNLAGITNPVLSFDVSFVYDQYGPPLLPVSVDFADTLEVLASTDCGAHFVSIYRKGGADLSTYADPILNATDLDSLFRDPADSNWRKETISLNSFAGAGASVIFKFNYISGLGGAINLDNVFVGTPTSVSAPKPNAFRISPNPARDAVTVSAEQGTLKKLELYDVTGKLLAAQPGSGAATTLSLDVSSLPQGIYMVHIFGTDGMAVRKLSVIK